TGRAKGASSLGQDTDAEYIIRRNGGLVSVSRERFKDGPELPDLTYAPEVIDLGYSDEEGEPVTSLIMRPTAPMSAQRRRSAPTGRNNVVVYEAILACSKDRPGVPIDEENILAVAIANMPPPQGQRDTRRQHAVRSLVQLANQGF